MIGTLDPYKVASQQREKEKKKVATEQSSGYAYGSPSLRYPLDDNEEDGHSALAEEQEEQDNDQRDEHDQQHGSLLDEEAATKGNLNNGNHERWYGYGHGLQQHCEATTIPPIDEEDEHVMMNTIVHEESHE